jgi:hypothetical protein
MIGDGKNLSRIWIRIHIGLAPWIPIWTRIEVKSCGIHSVDPGSALVSMRIRNTALNYTRHVGAW